MEFDIVIIGGGIAGCYAAIDLAKLGNTVALIEKKPFVGGMTNQIGQAYPTNDCASCLSPTAFHFQEEGFRKCFPLMNFEPFQNVDLFTLAEVKDIQKINSRFQITWDVKPRHVNENCNNCKDCERACPREVEDEFNCKMTKRKLIYLPHPNAIPPEHVVDREKCGDCEGYCADACPQKAIDLDEKTKSIKATAKSIIIATGFSEAKPKILKSFGFGQHENVLTQLMLARFLDPWGPSRGKLQFLETRHPVNSVLMSFCTGSRDRRYYDYCSKICCAYGLKHALILRDQGIDVTICYMDLRLEGLASTYYEQAREKNINFIRGKVASIERDPKTHELCVHVEDTFRSEVISFFVDAVVLTPPLIPAEKTGWLASKLEILIDENGYFDPPQLRTTPVETLNPGVFVIGCAQAPMDLAQVSIQVNAAVLKIQQYLEEI
ncbi:MAG: FAD-dependent oxidoreductase [Candidatus Helarchaeota archaeon]